MLPSTLYKSAFNSSAIGTALLSPTPDPVILAVNDALLAFAPCKREEMVGIRLFAAFPENPEDLADTGVAALRTSIHRVIATGKPDTMTMQRYPIRVTTPDGESRFEERFWNTVNTPVFGPDGQLLCISHQTMDVTQQALAETALRRSETRFRKLFNSIDQGFCIVEMLFDLDGNPVDGRICTVNPMFETQTGFSNLVGKRMRELTPGIEQYWFDTYGKVARTGEPIRFEGEAKAQNRWYDVYAFRADQADANKVAILFRDMTEKRHAEDRLRNSERLALEAARQAEAERRRLDAVLEAVPVGIAVSDAVGAISLANHTFRQQWGSGHPSPGGVDEFRHWKGRWADGSERHDLPLAPHDWTTARILRGEETLDDVIEIESFDTPPVHRIVLHSGAPIRDGEGKVVGAVVAQQDITDRVKAEENLRQADRRKDEFLAMLAHELRNPLAPIAAAADLLALGHLDEAQVQQTSEIISRQVRHMTGLVDDLLDVSRVTRGLVTLHKERLDAKRIVFDAIEQVRPLIESHGHRLTVHTPPAPAFVLGDQKRLVQVIANVLNNAAKYTPEGGNIVLSVEVDGDFVRMIVADDGIGMVPELVERAFELFAQAERTPDRRQGGLGIGLALVKSLVELHGGSVTASSAGLGQGSRFVVCLPHAPALAEQAEPADAVAMRAVPGNALKVMVVDDNADAARMLAMFVEAMGHQVFVELHPRKALERAKVERPHASLLDIGLPDMDGKELACRLRAQPETSASVLVAVTGYGRGQDRENALDAGFDYHFVKPVDTARLATVLDEIGRKLAGC